MQRTTTKGITGQSERPDSPSRCAPPPIEIVSQGMLCRIHVWNDREWANLTEAEKPIEHAFVPGLGWVGAIPVNGLN
jgi:hypothetical protein